MSIYKLHFKIGVIIGLFLIIMSITGLALNNADFLNLDNKFISNEFIYSIYGFKVSKAEIDQEHMEGFSLYKIILDIHNGRILKGYGKYFADIVGILTIIIVVTGYARYIRRIKNTKLVRRNAKN